MATSGEALVDGIQRDLECPQCEYNLRGLRGDIVSCPECGAVCDVAKLVSQRWTKPWHQAPWLTRLYLPTAWAVLAGMAWLSMYPVLRETGRSLVLLAGLAGLAIWCRLMWMARAVFRSNEGLYLALAGHLILAGYLLGVVGVFFGIAGAAETFSTDALRSLGFAVMTVVSAVAVPLCYRAEKMVAKRCIRRYLARQAGAG